MCMYLEEFMVKVVKLVDCLQRNTYRKPARNDWELQ